MVETQLESLQMEPDRALLLGNLRTERLALEKELLPRIFTLLKEIGVRIESTTTIEMDGLKCSPARPPHIGKDSLIYDKVTFTPDPTGLQLIETRSINEARDEIDEAKSRGVIREGLQSPALTDDEFSKLKIVSAQIPGVHHIGDAKADYYSYLSFGNQDASHVVKAKDLICCSISDGASGVPLSGFGSELLVKSATYHVVALLEELKPTSLLEPEFRGKLHARIFEDLAKYCHTLNIDPETAFNNLFGATLDIKIVTPSEHITLSISDGMIIKNGKAQDISDITNRDNIIPPKYTMPPTPIVLLVADTGLKLPPGREGEKASDGETDLKAALANESLAFQIVEYGSTRSILEGESTGIGSDGLRFTAFKKFSSKAALLPIKEWHDQYGEKANLAEALYLIAVDIEKDEKKILNLLPKWEKALKEEALYSGRDLYRMVCDESPDFQRAIVAGCRTAVRDLISKFRHEVNPYRTFEKLPSNPEELIKLFLDIDNELCAKLADSIGIDSQTFYDETAASSRIVLEAGRKAALEILKRDFNFDPKDKPLIPPFDDATYIEIHAS